MAKHPDDFMKMTDEELVRFTLSGDVGTYAHRMGETAISLRNSLRNLQAARETAKYTKNIALATWGVVMITLLTQSALILLAIFGRK